MPSIRTARAVLAALALLALAPPSAGAWPFPHRSPLPAGDGPVISALDPDTRTLYVANDTSNTVSVIAAGASRRGASVPVGATPIGVGLDGGTLYVANLGDGTVSVIDAARCNARTSAACAAPVATVSVGGAPVGVAIDPVTHTVYVTDPDNGVVRVIDGAACNRAMTASCARPPVVASSLPGGQFGTVDAATRTLYVPGADGDTMAVIDIRGCNARVITGCATPPPTVPAGAGPVNALVDPSTHTVYVMGEAPPGLPQLAIVDGAACNALERSGCDREPAAIASVGPGPAGLALDRLTHTLYVPGAGTDTLSALDTTRCSARFTGGCDTRWPTLAAGNWPQWAVLDPLTGALYVSDYLDDAVAVVDARDCSALRRSGCRDEAPSRFIGDAFNLAISSRVHTAYVTHANLHDLVMFDTARCNARAPEGCSPVVGPVAGVSGPYDIAFDPGTDTLYATNQGDRTVVLIDPARCNAKRAGGCAPVGPAIAVPRPVNVSINPATHAIYVAGYADTLSVIDGRHCNVHDFSGCTAVQVPAGPTAFAAAADPVTGTVYASNFLEDGTVSVLAGGQVKATIHVGAWPQKLEVDAVTRTLYVANSAFGEQPGTLSAVDLRHCNATDASRCAASSIPTGRQPTALAIDPVSHAVYTTDQSHSTSTVIAGGRVLGAVPVGFTPWDVAVDPVSKTVYVTDNGEGRVSVFGAR